MSASPVIRALHTRDAPAVACLDADIRGPEAWDVGDWRHYLGAGTAWGVTRAAEPDDALEVEDKLLAFAVFSAVLDEAELLFIGVREGLRGQRLGRRLLEFSLSALAAQQIVTVFLEVSEENLPARALYTALGFTFVGKRSAYYRDGSTALLLRREHKPG